jgi:uncharacterized protein YqhQ
MTRTPDAWSVAVRARDGSVHTEKHAVAPPSSIAFVRGPASIVSSLRIGTRAIRVALRETLGAEVTTEQMAVTFGAGGVAVLAIFVVAPGVLIGGRGASGAALEAVIRAAMLVAYLFVISRSAQTRLVLRYHGAEHKTIAAYEQLGRLPTPDEARAASPIHMRCGTTFVALFVITCGVVFAVVPRSPLWLGALARVAITPIVVALAYEVMRGAAREPRAIWSRVLTWPGRALQHVTTRAPTDDEIGVAIAALRTLLD